MNVLNKLTKKNLKLNKSRTVVTIIGIILSTALLVATTGLMTSVLRGFTNIIIEERGEHHITFLNESQKELDSIINHKETEKYFIYKYLTEQVILSDKLEDNDSNGYSSSFVLVDENTLKSNESNLISGRFPKNDSEVVLHEGMYGKEFDTGDTIKISDKDYTVVGFVNYLRNINIMCGITGLLTDKTDDLSISVRLSNPRDYKEYLEDFFGEKLSKKEGSEYIYNDDLLDIEAGKISESNLSVILGLGSIVLTIIILTSVICIRNSFAISTTEKIRQYGMLASVGARPAQIRQNVLYEGFILGLIAVPIGFISGTFATYVLCFVGNKVLEQEILSPDIQLIPSLIAILLAVLTIFLSSIGSALRASRISEVDSIRSNKDIKTKGKNVTTPKFIYKLFKMGGVFAYKNIKRNKKKYRTTTLAIIASVTVYITLSYFLDVSFQMVNSQYKEVEFNINIYDLESDAQIEEIKALANGESFKAQKEFSSVIPKEYLSLEADKHLRNMDRPPEYYVDTVTFDEYYYNKYIKSLGINATENTAILFDDIKVIEKNEDGKNVETVIAKYDIEKPIEIIANNEVVLKNLDIIRVEKIPQSLDFVGRTILIHPNLYEKIIKQYNLESSRKLSIQSENSYELEDKIKEYARENNLQGLTLINLEEYARQMSNIVMFFSIFLYGFMAVVILVGLTNIFNTISANMELRKKEFATLQSVGMTKKEFMKMINFEAIFFTVKSLLWGIPLGILGAFVMFGTTLDSRFEIKFHLPIIQIIIASLVTFVIIYVIMRKKLGKISKQNIVETIRKENI